MLDRALGSREMRLVLQEECAIVTSDVWLHLGCRISQYCLQVGE